MKQFDQQGDEHRLMFDSSPVEAALGYLRNKTDQNLERLISMQGSKLAYNHFVWSSFGSKLTIREFWKKSLKQTVWSKQLEAAIGTVREYLTSQEESRWLSAVLRYLPEGHVFRTTVYLIVNYDNVVYSEDVALNLNSRQFHVDHREAVYYLIHELAHAGYFRYHRMPELTKIRTIADLLDVVMLLTHLEGMGVISSFRLRVGEGGLLDGDYQILLNDDERKRRVRDYFNMLSRLENRRSQKLRKEDFQVFDDMSGKTTRLWYVTGCHMAQKIERECGVETLRHLVKRGCEEFFKAYRCLEDPFML
jgi:hypothetical protein